MTLHPLPHRWDLTPKEAIALQLNLAGRVMTDGALKRLRLVAGADAAFTKDKQQCIAGVVVWDVVDSQVVEQHVALTPVTFPYVPGLLTFREAPALLEAIRCIRSPVDAFMFDGHGYAHPRRLGLASHMGILLDRPALGCAKSRFIGEAAEPDDVRGATTPLLDKGERIGTLVRTRDHVKPVYISVGHRLSLPEAERIALRCGNGFRLPEPTRLADKLVAQAKRNQAPS